MQRQRGFSLLEVMIAATVLSIGFSSLSLLSLHSLNTTGAAQDQTQAALLASEMAGIISISPDYSAWQAGWAQSLARTLPRGNGVVCRDSSAEDGGNADAACDDAGPTVVKVFWHSTAAAPGRYVLVANP